MEQLLDQIRTWRRHLHAIPEIGFQEYKTSKYLYEELKKMGYQPLKITETGIAVYLDFHKEKTLAFRSDIDALEIKGPLRQAIFPSSTRRRSGQWGTINY